MLNINFNLRDASSTKETPINIVLRYKNQRLVYPSGLKIIPKYWDSKGHRARLTEKFKEYPEFNARLTNIASKINQEFMRYLNENENEIPTPETLKHHLDIKFERVEKKNYNFFDYFEKHIERLHSQTNRSTGKKISGTYIASYNNTLNILRDFQKGYPRKISFDTIDMDFYFDLTEYLSKTRLQSTNTIGKIIRNIKVVMNDATENGQNKNLTFKNKHFITVSEKAFSIYLNEAELDQLYDLDLSASKKLDAVRDLFLIGCYTGLRYSDYTNIKPENIDLKNNILQIQTQKTGVTVAIPLHRVVRSILKKYDNALPRSISNQKTNDYLKELGQRVPLLNEKVNKAITKGGMKIEKELYKYELLSSHTARRSFATNLYLSGFPSISIMKITGHTTEKSFMKYIKITPTENAKLLQLHWDKQPQLRAIK